MALCDCGGCGKVSPLIAIGAIKYPQDVARRPKMFKESQGKTTLVRLLAVLMLIPLLLTACGGSSSLVGRWRHLPNPTPTPLPTPTPSGNLFGDLLGGLAGGLSGELPCDISYPDTIEFFRDGTVDWGGLSGKYDKVDNGRIRVELLGAMLSTYQFSISGELLILRDDSGCEVRYQRISR